MSDPSLKKLNIKGFLLGFSLFIVISGISVYGFYYSRGKSYLDFESNFKISASTIDSLVSKRMQIYISALYNTKAFVVTAEKINAEKWRDFMKNAEVFNRYPGIFAISYIERVLKSDKKEFVSSVVNDKSIDALGFPQFTIHPESEGDVSYVIKYIEPFIGRQGAFGLDWTTDPIRSEALKSAMETGDPKLSRVYTSASTGEAVFGAIIPAVTDTLGVKNMVLFTFSPKELFKDVLHDLALDSQVRMEIYQSSDQGNEPVKIYDTNPENKTALVNALRKETESEFLGQKWTLKFTSLKNQSTTTQEQAISYATLIFGLIFAIISGTLVKNSITSNTAIENKIKDAKRDLESEKKRLEVIFDNSPDPILIMGINASGDFENFLDANAMASTKFGYTKEELLKINLLFLQNPDSTKPLDVQKIKEEVKKSGSYEFETEIVTKDKKIIPIDIKETTINYNGKGAILLIARDISERARHNNELKEKVIELEKLNKLLLGREVRMVKMKEELEALKTEINEKKS